MSCPTKSAPQVRSHALTPATAVAAGAAGAGAGTAGAEPACGPAPCAWTEFTDATAVSTDWAAVAVKPALVRPPTKPRREIPCDKYLATRSPIIRSFGFLD